MDQKKPTINVTHKLLDNTTEAIAALKRDENIYQRETKLVFVTRVTREQSEESLEIMGDDGKTHRQLVEGFSADLRNGNPNTERAPVRCGEFSEMEQKI